MANPATDKVQPPENAATAALLSYLVPGLGQIYQGRVGKGILFFVCVYTLFFYGMFLGSWQNVYLSHTTGSENAENNPWGLPRVAANLYNRPHFVGQFWVGVAAWPAVYQYYVYDSRRDETPPLGGFQRQPPDEKANPTGFEKYLRLQRDGDKTWDLAWVYTVIAGVLNVMVIYDAFAGPAFVARPARKEEPSSHATATPTPVS
jgi:TM2 domain-containing membrane protein YozV